MGLMASGRVDDPVRMIPVQLAVLIGHLQLKPQAKLQTQGLNLLGKPLDPVRQAVRIGPPVSKTAGLRTPGTKPPVVQDKQLHPVLLGIPGNLQKLFLRKIKVGSLPVI